MVAVGIDFPHHSSLITHHSIPTATIAAAVRYHEVNTAALRPERSARDGERIEDYGMQMDWPELDQRADRIIMKYSVVGGAWNLLPMPFDVMGATGTFSKMATELASVYGVMIPGARSRQIGSAIATGTASVMGTAMGIAYLGSRPPK